MGFAYLASFHRMNFSGLFYHVILGTFHKWSVVIFFFFFFFFFFFEFV